MIILLILLVVFLILLMFFPKVIAMLMVFGIVAFVCYSICEITGHKLIGLMCLILAGYVTLSSMVGIMYPAIKSAKEALKGPEAQEYREDIDKINKTIEQVDKARKTKDKIKKILLEPPEVKGRKVGR